MIRKWIFLWIVIKERVLFAVLVLSRTIVMVIVAVIYICMASYSSVTQSECNIPKAGVL